MIACNVWLYCWEVDDGLRKNKIAAVEREEWLRRLRKMKIVFWYDKLLMNTIIFLRLYLTRFCDCDKFVDLKV
jgi:hypothetical protein